MRKKKQKRKRPERLYDINLGFDVVLRNEKDPQAWRDWATKIYETWDRHGRPALLGPGAEQKLIAQAVLGLDY
jgi:hypothetical protein